MMFDEAVIVSRKPSKARRRAGRKFKMYYEYSEPAAKIPSHRMLAIRRGAKEGVLNFEIELDPRAAARVAEARKVLKQPGDWTPHLELAIEDSYERLLNPSIQTEVRLELKDRSDRRGHQGLPRESGEPAARAARRACSTVLAIDPGIRTGCKIAVVDDTGNSSSTPSSIRFEPRNDLAGSAQDAGVADRATQRAGHRDRQRHRLARDRRLRAGLSAAGQT